MSDPVREFLDSAKDAHARAQMLSRKVAELTAQVERITPSYSGMPSGGGGDSSSAWVALAQLRSSYLEEKIKAETLEKSVSDFIETLPTPENRVVLHLKYCERLRWPEVMKGMREAGYYFSDRHIYRIHGNALDEARERWKEIHNEWNEETRDT